MPRNENWESNSAYVEMVRQIAPLKNRLANARFEASQVIDNAKKEVEAQMLEAIRFGLDNGLTQYAIGKAVGQTNAAKQRELIERARQFGGY